MTQFAFGSGKVWGIKAGSNQTPVLFGVGQNVSIDFNSTAKPIFSQKVFPVAVGRGTTQVNGKVVMGQFNGRMMNDLFFGASSASGQILAANDEAGSVPGSSTYTIQVTNHVGFTTDLGVKYSATGLPLTRVASVSAVGTYSLDASTGTYTFYSGDASAALLLSYLYTTTGGQTISIGNPDMGAANIFKTVASLPFEGNQANFTLNKCISTKLSLQTQLEDFTKPEFDFSAFVDDSGNLGTISLAEAN